MSEVHAEYVPGLRPPGTYTSVKNAQELMALPWDYKKTTNGFELWELRFELPNGKWGMAWVAPRRPGCDRGFWELNVDGNCWAPAWLDHQDNFPRYFMVLDHACKEAKLWLCWRLFKVKVEVDLG